MLYNVNVINILSLTESLAKYYESQGKKTVFILVTQIEEVQAQFVAKYKDKVILPLGVPKKVSCK